MTAPAPAIAPRPDDSPRPRAVVAVLVAVVLALAGCGIPTDDSPRILAADAATTVAAPPSAPANSANSVDLYLGTGDAAAELVAVSRGLDGPPNMDRTLTALLIGPTTKDLEDGLTTFIPAESELLGWELSEGTLTIDLTDPFYTRQGEAAVAAFAQVVLTVTSLNSYQVSRVRFRSNGDPIQAFVQRPGTTRDVVTRSDYSSRDPEAG